MLNTRTVTVNSFHHQAVKKVAPSFKVTAVAADKIIEAIERVLPLKGYKDGGGLIMGVQFHPEALYSKGGNERFLGIFKKFVEAAEKRASKKLPETADGIQIFRTGIVKGEREGVP